MFKIKGFFASAEGELRKLRPADGKPFMETTDEGRAVIARIKAKQQKSRDNRALLGIDYPLEEPDSNRFLALAAAECRNLPPAFKHALLFTEEGRALLEKLTSRKEGVKK